MPASSLDEDWIFCGEGVITRSGGFLNLVVRRV